MSVRDAVTQARNVRTRIESAVQPVAVPPAYSQAFGVVRLRNMIVISFASDHLVCADAEDYLGGSYSSVTYNVALPYTLRQSSWYPSGLGSSTYDGYTYSATSWPSPDGKYTRTKTKSGVGSEVQIITPMYYRTAMVGTNYAAAIVIAADLGSGNRYCPTGLRYVDLNIDGRAWAKRDPQ